MGRTDISGGTFPLVIDQDDITAPDFPRSQDWWDRWVPLWITATVRDDGTVTLDVNGKHANGTRDELTGAKLRRSRAVMAQWLGSHISRHLAPPRSPCTTCTTEELPGQPCSCLCSTCLNAQDRAFG